MEKLNEQLKKLKILIVDDNSTNVMLLERILRINGYDYLETLTDSRNFFEVYRAFSPDILLLDLNMPYIDGFEILAWLTAENKHNIVPVIVITAQSEQENKLKALKLGAQNFIGKPFDHTEVISRIGNLLQVRYLHKQVQTSNLELEQKVLERTREIEVLQTEIVDRLMRAAEFRDQETGNHIARIGEYAYLLGTQIGMSESEAIQLLGASRMHDIGKVGIPDHILLKPSKLTETEMALMKEHASKGAQILSGSNSDLVKLAEQIALTHHEKWDGSGYPNRLKGKEIPLAGRITALADVFDALMTERPYKKAWTFDEATEFIIKEKGKAFDPEVVDAFLERINDFLKITLKL